MGFVSVVAVVLDVDAVILVVSGAAAAVPEGRAMFTIVVAIPSSVVSAGSAGIRVVSGTAVPTAAVPEGRAMFTIVVA